MKKHKLKKRLFERQYWLRNIHPQKMDVSLSDIRYRIPYSQARNLLSSTARISDEKLIESIKNGSIKKRIDQGFLIEVKGSPDLQPPFFSVSEPQNLTFPNRSKSGIVVEETSVVEGVSSSILADDEEFLKELDLSSEELSGPPIIAKKEKDDVKAKD